MTLSGVAKKIRRSKCEHGDVEKKLILFMITGGGRLLIHLSPVSLRRTR